MAGIHTPKKPATPRGESATSELTGTQTDTETGTPPAQRKSVEAENRSGGHDIESNGDVSQSGNVETGVSSSRESLESLPAASSGDVERM
jgi:hypothetical protein